MKDPTASERKRRERAARLALGMVRRDVYAHPDDWPAIKVLAEKLQLRRSRKGTIGPLTG